MQQTHRRLPPPSEPSVGGGVASVALVAARMQIAHLTRRGRRAKVHLRHELTVLTTAGASWDGALMNCKEFNFCSNSQFPILGFENLNFGSF